MFKSFTRGQNGFTLIELLIVIAVLGVLVAIAAPSISHFMHSGKVGAANAELATVQTAAHAFMAEGNGTAPTVIADLYKDTNTATQNFLIIAPRYGYTFATSGIVTPDATNANAVADGLTVSAGKWK